MATKVKLIADGVITPDQITLTTASTGTNTTAPATTAFVQQEISALVDSSPDALNTLNELAAALGDDANFSTTVTNSIATKAPLATPQFTNRVGIGVGAHATAALNITNTSQHIRLNNGSELGIISLLSTGELELWGHGDGESINFRTGSGSGTVAMNIVGTNVGIGTDSPNTTLTLSDGTDEFDFGVTTNQLLIKSVTSDGSDDQRIIIDAGNGGLSSTRGAYLALSGNEASSEAGKAIYQMGNVTGSAHVFRKAGGDDAATIDSSGNVGIGGAPDSSGRLLVQNGGTNQIVLTNNDSGTTNLNMGNFAGGAYISQNYYYSSGHQADDNTKGAYEVFIGDDAYAINYHSAGAMGTRRRDFAITSAGNVGMGTNAPSFASGSGLEIERAGITTLRLQNTSGKSVELSQDSDFKIECMNTSSDIHLIPTAFVGVGTETPDSTLHVKGTGQLNLLKIERAASTPGITFVNGADTAGSFGFQLMDNDEYWAGAYDGSNYDYWFKGNSSVFRVEKPVASSTDSGTRQYSHLCTGSFYQGTGAIVINTNIPAHNATGNANMFSIKIRGFQYSDGGQIDMNVGCYAGEGAYYSATYGGAHVPSQWVDEVHFAENTSTDTVAIILGTTSSNTNYEIAVVDFIQGFQNVNESYAEGWTMTRTTDLSGYGSISDCAPKRTVPVEGYHAYLTNSAALGSGVVNLSSTGLTASYNRGNRFNASNGRFTASQDGVYHFDMSVMGGSTSTALTYLSAEIRVNGGTRYIGGWFGYNTTATQYKAASGSVTIPLDSGDYVEFYMEISASHTIIGGNAGYTYISGIKIA